MDRGNKPHTRQKMKLMTQKKLRCVECSKQTHKRHVLLCLHSYCSACYSSLTQAKCNSERGVLCSVCKTFDTLEQKEERDDLPPIMCKVHPNKRYILYCVTCSTRLCYSCKMGKHYTHEAELLQNTLERAVPLMKEKALKDQELLLEKAKQNEKDLEAMDRKAERLELYLKEQHRKLEQSLKEHYQKVRSMVDGQVDKRKRALEAQTELIKYFQHVRLPFHTRDTCPQEGAIHLQWHPKVEQECQIGACEKTLNYSLEEVFKPKGTKIEEKLENGASDTVYSVKGTDQSKSESSDTKVKTGSPEGMETCDRIDTQGLLDSSVRYACGSPTIEKCPANLNDNRKDTKSSLFTGEKDSDCCCKHPSNREKDAKTSAKDNCEPITLAEAIHNILSRDKFKGVNTLCQNCVTRHEKTTENGVNYSEVYNALSSPSVTELGEVVTNEETKFVRYTPGNIDMSNLLDEVDFDKNGNLIDLDTGNIITENLLGKVEIVCQPNKPDTSILKEIHEKLIEKAKQERRKRELPLTETCSCHDKLTVSPTDCSIRDSKVNLASLATAEFKYTGTLTYNNKSLCYRLGYFNDNIWLLSDQCYTTVLDSSSGSTLEYLSFPEEVKGICSIHPFNSGHLLIAAKTGIYLVDGTAHVVCKLIKGSFSDVCLHGHLIAMLESAQSHVKVIDISTDPPTLAADFHVLLTESPVKSVVVHRECVFVATSDHKIKKYDLRGEVVWQWGGEGTGGPGEMLSPVVSAVDTTESILVVDKDNHRLQLVDSHCQWQLLPLKEVINPTDVIVTDKGSLFVLNSDSRTIYCYSYTP